MREEGASGCGGCRGALASRAYAGVLVTGSLFRQHGIERVRGRRRPAIRRLLNDTPDAVIAAAAVHVDNQTPTPACSVQPQGARAHPIWAVVGDGLTARSRQGVRLRVYDPTAPTPRCCVTSIQGSALRAYYQVGAWYGDFGFDFPVVFALICGMLLLAARSTRAGGCGSTTSAASGQPLLPKAMAQAAYTKPIVRVLQRRSVMQVVGRGSAHLDSPGARGRRGDGRRGLGRRGRAPRVQRADAQ